MSVVVLIPSVLSPHVTSPSPCSSYRLCPLFVFSLSTTAASCSVRALALRVHVGPRGGSYIAVLWVGGIMGGPSLWNNIRSNCFEQWASEQSVVLISINLSSRGTCTQFQVSIRLTGEWGVANRADTPKSNPPNTHTHAYLLTGTAQCFVLWNKNRRKPGKWNPLIRINLKIQIKMDCDLYLHHQFNTYSLSNTLVFVKN